MPSKWAILTFGGGESADDGMADNRVFSGAGKSGGSRSDAAGTAKPSAVIAPNLLLRQRYLSSASQKE